MKKMFSTVFLFSVFTAQLTYAESFIATSSGVAVRKGPATSEPVISVVHKDDIIEGTKEGRWVRSELADGRSGFISSRYLKQTSMPAKTGVLNKTIPPTVSFLPVAGQIAPLRTINITAAPPTADFKNIVAERDAAVAQTKALLEDNARLKAEASKNSVNLKLVQNALASANSKLHGAEVERLKNVTDLDTLKKQLVIAQKPPLVIAQIPKQPAPADSNNPLLLADKGVAVFFKGIGESLMSTSDGITTLRFQLAEADKADRVLMESASERYVQGDFVYYVVDTKSLAL